ncbi:iron complex outermembrane recepter protein [bacterium A37T11]|nr:iron complex outermembrane recepter protein [bacterium A37T11]
MKNTRKLTRLEYSANEFFNRLIYFIIDSKYTYITMKIKFFRCIVLVLLAVISMNVYAQRLVSGIVTDDQGVPLAGATVKIKGQNKGSSTNPKGAFTIDVKEGVILEVSYIGFELQSILVDDQKNLNIKLLPSKNSLNEVVVTGLGESREKRQLGYAMTQVTGKDIAKTNAINPIAALQGMVPGLQVNAGTGGPQSSPRFLIRGAGSLNPFGNTPLIVVDGIIMDEDVVLPNKGGEQDFGNILKNFNLDDIESMSVLNGGSVTALYGSRASNGVILITTKKGYSQRGIGVSFTHSEGFDDPYASIDFQNKYGTGRFPDTEFPIGAGGIPQLPGDVFGYNYGPAFDGRTVLDPGGHEMKYQVNNNILDLYQTGRYINSNLALQGGNDQTTFRLSYSNSYAKGTTPKNKLDRNSIALRATHRMGNVVILDAGATYVHSNTLNPNRSSGDNSLMYGLNWGVPREYDLKYWSNHYLDPINGGTSSLDPSGMSYIYFNLYEQRQEQIEDNFRGNINAKINFTKQLQLENSFSADLFSVGNEKKTRGQEEKFNGGKYETYVYRVLQTRYRSNLNFTNKYGNYDLTLQGGAEVNRSEQKGNRTWTNGMTVPDVFRLSNSVEKIGFEEYKPNTTQDFSLFFQGALSYKNWLTLNVYGRNDWDSTLLYPDETGTYSYFYPGMDLAWIFSDALKLPANIFDFAKIRFSYNIVGKGTSVYRAMIGYYIPDANYTGTDGDIQRYKFDSGTLGNRNLVPERSHNWEVGTEIKMLKNRLGLDFTFYRKNTKDQIVELPVDQESGVTNILINSGNVQNQGIEARFFGTPIKNNNFSWDVAFNYTRNRSKIIELAPGVTVSGLEGEDGIRAIAEVGGEYGTMVSSYGYARYQARDANGDPLDDPNNGKHVLSPTGSGAAYVRSTNYAYGLEKEVKVGSIMPKFLGSLINTFNYKAYTLSFMLDSKFGGYVWSPTYNYGSQLGQIKSTLWGRKGEEGSVSYTDANGKEAWGVIPDGVFGQGAKINGVDVSGKSYQEAIDMGLKTPMPTWAYYSNSYNWAGGIRERAAFESSWIMLRDVSFSYDLPRDMASRLKLNNLRLTLSGRNLGYLYNNLPDHLNPEDLKSTGSSAAFLGGGTPLIRSFTLTVNTNF